MGKVEFGEDWELSRDVMPQNPPSRTAFSSRELISAVWRFQEGPGNSKRTSGLHLEEMSPLVNLYKIAVGIFLEHWQSTPHASL